MNKILFSIVLSLFFITGCGETDKKITYDYDSLDKTLYLTVTPSNKLVFYGGDKSNNHGEFTLSFDTNKLTFYGIDENDMNLGNNSFGYEDKIVKDCMRLVASHGYCKIPIVRAETAKIGDSGYIILQFIYNDDVEVNRFKRHKLVFTYETKPDQPIPKP